MEVLKKLVFWKVLGLFDFNVGFIFIEYSNDFNDWLGVDNGFVIRVNIFLRSGLFIFIGLVEDLKIWLFFKGCYVFLDFSFK